MVTPHVTELHRAGTKFEPARVIAMRAAQIGGPAGIGDTRSPVKGLGAGMLDDTGRR
jgi:hypothetical protein